MDLLTACFENLKQQKRAAFIPYMMAGDPNPDMTVPLMDALVAGGADIIELGMPFSDPMADGPVIQLASERALAAGSSMEHIFDSIKIFRQKNTITPIILMGYLNPIEVMGYEIFAKASENAGVNGVLIVDVPPEEAVEMNQCFKKHQIAMIFLLAPTSTDSRIQSICEQASGYLYYVSLKGVTGSAQLDMESVANRIETIRQYTTLPIGVGFGIKDVEMAAKVAKISDAVIVGSALVQRIATAADSKAVIPFLQTLRTAIETA